MRADMYWLILILCNVPVYLGLAWLVFDTKAKAASSFLETLLALVVILLVPRGIGAFLGRDESNAYGICDVGVFFAGCAMLTYGEHVLIQKMFA